MIRAKAFPVLILALVIILRILFDYINDIEYHYEETQYWVWSKNLSLSYLTKGPAVSWLIFVSEEVFGQSYFGIKFFPLLALLGTILLLGEIARELSNDSKSRLFGLALAALSPSIFFLGGIASTDIFLFFFWSLFLYGYVKFLKSKNENWFYLIGLATGLGLLSKLSMILLPVSVIIYSAFTSLKKYLVSTKFFISILLALIIFSPVLIWNYSNDWLTLSHEITHLKASIESANPEVLFFSLLLTAPLSVFVLRRNFYLHITSKLNRHVVVPIALILIFFFIKSLFGKVQLNWPIPVFLVFIPLIASYLKETRFSLIPGFFIISMISILSNLNFLKIFTDTDPLHPMRGWKNSFQNLNIDKNYSVLVSNDYKLLSQVSFYLKDTKNIKYDRNPDFRMTHYDTWDNEILEKEKIIYLTYDEGKIFNQSLNCILIASSNINPRKDLSLYTCKKK